MLLCDDKSKANKTSVKRNTLGKKELPIINEIATQLISLKHFTTDTVNVF